jgi:hemoglobin
MHTTFPARLSVFSWMLALTASGSGLAADGPLATRDLDARIDQAIVRTINIGAPIYNQGDAAGCYRLYQGTLITIEPLLGHRPELAREVAKGLQDAEFVPTFAQRATNLRTVLDRVLTAVRTPVAAAPAQPQPGAGAKTLWTRLGGEPAVKAVVHDFVVLAAGDPQVDFTRGGRYPLDAAGVVNLEKLLVELVSAVTGGPLKYSGRAMKALHQDMGITNGQFDALAGDLAVVLQKYNVPRKETEELLAVIGSTRKDIVAAPSAATPPPPPPTADAGIPLWNRLGGEPAVKAVVHDFVALAASDPQVDFTRGGKFAPDAAGVANLEKQLVDLISAVSGGPRMYEGRPMKPVHQGMAITDAQFDALARDLAAVLQKYRVPRKEADELLAVVASTRKDVVEAGQGTPPR